jgi:hypothetical protein
MLDFKELFTTYSNTDLLNIIDSPNSYQPLAVETAKTILASRQLGSQDIEIATMELKKLRREKEAKAEKLKEIENKIKNMVDSVLSLFNPIQAKAPSPDKIIKIISITFCGLFLFQLFKEFGMIKFMFTDREAKWDFTMVIYFLPLLIVPTATILFFKRTKIEWLLLTIFLTFSAVSSIGLFILALNRDSSRFPALQIIFPHTSPITHILALMFFAGMLWSISKESIREIYSVNIKYMITTISIISTITLLTMLGLFL